MSLTWSEVVWWEEFGESVWVTCLLSCLAALSLVSDSILCEKQFLISSLAPLHSLQDINSVAVSPNDKLLATGSQDRTAKLWSLAGGADLGLLGVFRGHRRGVWTVCFSPVDQVLATSSADGTSKLWSLQDFSCLKVGWRKVSLSSDTLRRCVACVLLFLLDLSVDVKVMLKGPTLCKIHSTNVFKQ